MNRVLIVDDEPKVRAALGRVVDSFGAGVEMAASGDEALARLERTRFGVVVVDIIMPGLDGVQFIRTARARDPGLRIVAISGGGSYEVAGYKPEAISTQAYLAAATKAGADAVLAKPFEIAELEAVLRPLLAVQGRPQA